MLAQKPIRRVLVYVDRSQLTAVTPDKARPDVDGLYPQSPDKYKGWETTIDISNLAAGSHEIEFRALEGDGCEADFAVIPVERVK